MIPINIKNKLKKIKYQIEKTFSSPAYIIPYGLSYLKFLTGKWKLQSHPEKIVEVDYKSTKLNKLLNLFNPDDFQASFSKLIKFLGEADTIITNTYHGMYWGILLNKKVLAFPFSSKLYTLKYKVPFCDTNSWRDQLKEARSYPEALEECRDGNQQFYQKVIELLN